MKRRCVEVEFLSLHFSPSSLSSRKSKERAAGARSLARLPVVALMSAYDTPSPAQGRRINNNGGGGSSNAAFETPASVASASQQALTNGFDSDASLSSVGALTRDLPPFASSPPIEAVVFAWGEGAESVEKEKERNGLELPFFCPFPFDLNLDPLDLSLASLCRAPSLSLSLKHTPLKLLGFL